MSSLGTLWNNLTENGYELRYSEVSQVKIPFISQVHRLVKDGEKEKMQTIRLSRENFLFNTSWANPLKSDFDLKYEECWRRKHGEGQFRYQLKIDDFKIIGKYNFVAQLNLRRARQKRQAQNIVGIKQPFDPDKFNFTSIPKEEIMFNVLDENEGKQNFLVINVSPLEDLHSLLVPSPNQCLPQIVTFDGLVLTIKLFLMSNSPSLRAGFNGLLAFASVNHLHFHFYSLNCKMALETIEVEQFEGNCHILTQYPAKGFAFQISSPTDIPSVAKDIVALTDALVEHDMPHNLYLTRGSPFDETPVDPNMRNSIRIYVWARTPSIGAKDSTAFNPALCELFGHFVIKYAHLFNDLTENFLSETLSSLTEPFVHARGIAERLFKSS